MRKKKKKIHLTVIENPTFRFDLRCNVFIFLIKVKHFLLKKNEARDSNRW